MADYGVAIRMGNPSGPAVGLGTVTLEHHRTPRAEVTAEVLSGGHVLHLAVACCLFNDVLRMADERGIVVTELRVTADGRFGGEPAASTGITYAIDIAGNASEDAVRRLVADAERDASIPLTLRQGTDVAAGTITIRTAGRP